MGSLPLSCPRGCQHSRSITSFLPTQSQHGKLNSLSAVRTPVALARLRVWSDLSTLGSAAWPICHPILGVGIKAEMSLSIIPLS